MSSLVMSYFLFWMMFIHKQECAVIRYQHNRNTLENVIQKYMNPLRRLSADLPNHAIEMEIEIHGSVPRQVTNDPRRFIRLINPHRPKPVPRVGIDYSEAKYMPGNRRVNNTKTTAATTTAKPKTVPATPPATPASAARSDSECKDPHKIAVFMEDLKKALHELEKKVINNTENSPAVITNSERNDLQKISVFMDDLKKTLENLENKLIINTETSPAVVTNSESNDLKKIPVFMEDLKKALDELEKKLVTNKETSPTVVTSSERNDLQKTPVFMEDLKKALDELEKKLITKENSPAMTTNGNAPYAGATDAPKNLNTPAGATQAFSQPVRSIDDIMELLKKAKHVVHRMPPCEPGDKNLEWVEVKIPKSVQL